MSFLNQLQARFHNFFLQKKMRKSKAERYSMSFEKAKRIGILFDATNPDNAEVVSSYRDSLKNKGKQVEILAYINDKEDHDQSSYFNYFNKRQLTWSLEPKSNEIEQFMTTPFDILLGLHIEGVQPLEYIAALSNAHLRVGQYREGKEYCYDLIIDTPENDNLKNFVGQVDYYIKNMNKEA
jgi:hypothetical protein